MPHIQLRQTKVVVRLYCPLLYITVVITTCFDTLQRQWTPCTIFPTRRTRYSVFSFITQSTVQCDKGTIFISYVVSDYFSLLNWLRYSARHNLTNRSSPTPLAFLLTYPFSYLIRNVLAFITKWHQHSSICVICLTSKISSIYKRVRCKESYRGTHRAVATPRINSLQRRSVPRWR